MRSEIDKALVKINNDCGNGTIVYGRNTYIKVNTFSTGIWTLNLALGCGGWPQGRIIEVYGPESGGKTTIALKAMASIQETMFDGEPGVAAFIDAEHALDPEWAELNGVNMDNILFSQPKSGEEVFKIVETLVRAGVHLVVVDSVAALVPQAELDGEIGDKHIAGQARLMSQGLRKLSGIIKNKNSTVIFINQLREKVGVMFGNPEITPGGRALKFYSSIRVEIKSTGIIKQGEELPIGRCTKASIVKNKVAPPFKKCDIDIYFNEKKQEPFVMYGAYEPVSLLKASEMLGIITKKGNFRYFGDENLGNGVGQATALLADDKTLFNKIRAAAAEAIKPKVTIEDNQSAKDKLEGAEGEESPEDILENSLEDDSES